MSQVLKVGSRKLDNSENWDVFHPNGTHMYTTSKKKAEWYLQRNLASIIDKNKIKLSFLPKGEGFKKEEIFGKTPRINRCVVCGIETNLQRHHVVPYHYRKFMPLIYKSRNHHDVVLICKKHHEECEEIAKQYKNQIAINNKVPTIEEMNLKHINFMVENLRDQFKALKLVDTILNRYNNIPVERVEWIANELNQLLNIDILKMDFHEIEEFHHKINSSIHSKKYELMNLENFLHGKEVIEKLKERNELEVFIKGWRVHFLETMKPQFMPVGWSVDFTYSREQKETELNK